MNFSDLIEDFVQHLRLERGLSANTITAYRTDLKDFVASSAVKTLDAVSASTVTAYFGRLAQQGKRPATLARKISSIKRFFIYQQSAGRIKENPAMAYAAPKISRYHPDYLSPEQIASIITSIDPKSVSAVRDRAIVETLYGCGLRLSELISLQSSNIEFEAGFVRVVGKGNKQRLVPLGRLAKEAITEYLTDRRLPKSGPDPSVIFLNRFGRKFSRVGLWQLIRKLVARAGISSRVTPHTFRHSFATHLLEGGAELRIVQEMLGHADISTTEIYTQIDRDYIIAEHRKYHPRELAGPRKPQDRS